MGIGYILMDKIFKIKVIAIALYGLVAWLLFYDDNFVQNSYFVQHPHHYSTVAFMLAVLSLGVILSAMVYNLAFYFYIRNRQYLYYALAQLSVLLSLVSLEALQIYPFTEVYSFQNFYLLDISQTFILLFSLLFIQSFFQTYQYKTLNQQFKWGFYLIGIDLILSLFLGHTFLTKFVPTLVWIAFILSEVYRTVENRDVPFYAIMIGWGGVIVILLLEVLYIINPHTISFPLLHIAFAFESMLLSFALSYRFKLIDDKEKTQQSLLLQQSRLASMGKMISIIAHQWRQPLNFLSYSLMFIKQKTNSDKELTETVVDAQNQLQYMSETIENFRNFYNPSKERSYFSVEQSVHNLLTLVRPTLNPLNIDITLSIKEDFKVYGNSNELEQVLLNIINNAKDIFVERKIYTPKIEIVVEQGIISIGDNGGGVDNCHQDRLFEPYFTTKEKSDGIGLYIAKTIIESEMGGRLYFVSDEHGTQFFIKI